MQVGSYLGSAILGTHSLCLDCSLAFMIFINIIIVFLFAFSDLLLVQKGPIMATAMPAMTTPTAGRKGETMPGAAAVAASTIEAEEAT